MSVNNYVFLLFVLLFFFVIYAAFVAFASCQYVFVCMCVCVCTCVADQANIMAA